LKFVADEGVDSQVIERLRDTGHTVWYLAEMDPGTADKEVLGLANREGAVLITADKDFGEMVYRQHLVHPGVILLRLAGLSPAAKAKLVIDAINAHSREFTQSFAVITHSAIRIRHHEA
jgi:predicted nuclease of predicted toxin-antitoxin system